MTVHVDTETNGFDAKKSSLLSIYAEKESGEVYERFYYPVEDYNDDAIAVNGLTKEKVDSLRVGVTYPEYYADDQDDLIAFLDEVSQFVAFNARFDYAWMPEAFKDKCSSIFCTMRRSKREVGARDKRGKVKFPKLKEAADYYDISIEDEDGSLEKVSSDKLHSASYDTKISKRIFEILTSAEGEYK